MKMSRSFYSSQESYLSAKRWQGLFYCVSAVILLLCGLVFDHRLVWASSYVFAYGLGYYFGRLQGLSESHLVVEQS